MVGRKMSRVEMMFFLLGSQFKDVSRKSFVESYEDRGVSSYMCSMFFEYNGAPLYFSAREHIVNLGLTNIKNFSERDISGVGSVLRKICKEGEYLIGRNEFY